MAMTWAWGSLIPHHDVEIDHNSSQSVTIPYINTPIMDQRSVDRFYSCGLPFYFEWTNFSHSFDPSHTSIARVHYLSTMGTIYIRKYYYSFRL